MVDQDSELVVGFLNVVATPHPPGVYFRLFKKASEKGVRFYGDQFAALTEPVRTGDASLFEGQLVVWTEIDESEPGIDKRKLTEVKLSDLNFRVPSNVGFNGKVFNYVFNEKVHTFAIETRTEQNRTISVTRVQKILGRLLQPPFLDTSDEVVEVTVIPEDDALDTVLGLKRIDRVEIYVKAPNNDDAATDFHRVMNRLEAQNAKSEQRTLLRAPGAPSIELDEENRALANVASSNGHVLTKGQDENGEPDTRSTKEYPKLVKVAMIAGQSFVIRLRAIAAAL